MYSHNKGLLVPVISYKDYNNNIVWELSCRTDTYILTGTDVSTHDTLVYVEEEWKDKGRRGVGEKREGNGGSDMEWSSWVQVKL